MPTWYLTFLLQDGWYAVVASQVREILRLPALMPVTEAAHYIVGVVNYRGRMLPVMDLGLRLGQPPQSYQIHDHVIVLEQESRLLGMIANEVHGVHEITPDMCEAPPVLTASQGGGCRVVSHLARLGATPIMILDHERLLDAAAATPAQVNHTPGAALDVRRLHSSRDERTGNGRPTPSRETMPQRLRHAAAWEREILIERARLLAQQLEEQSAAARLPLAIVGLSAEYFSVELKSVREFTALQRLTAVPCCPDYIVGDMNLRGAIVTVVDIRSILQMPVQAPAPTAKVMVVPLGDAQVGILIDDVIDVLDADPSHLTSLPMALTSINSVYLKGGVPYQGRILPILHLPGILSSGGLTVNEEV